jgi:hypothetical protein
MKKCLTLCLLLAFMMVASNGVCAIVKNGNFDYTDLSKNGKNTNKKLGELENGDWDIYSKIANWDIEKVNGKRAKGIEVQKNTVYNAQSGAYYIELDGDLNSSISQSLFLTSGDYQLSFSYRPRTNKKNDNTILFSVENIFSSSVDGVSSAYTDWDTVTRNFTVKEGSDGNFDLQFTAAGKSSTYGGFIDSVSVRSVATPIPSSLALLLSGVAGFVVLKRKKAMN